MKLLSWMVAEVSNLVPTWIGNGARTTAPSREKKKRKKKNMAAAGEQAVIQVCKDIDLAKIAKEMVSWEKYAPYCRLSQAEEIRTVASMAGLPT